MQRREIEEFERLFGGYPGAPKGEPTIEEEQLIRDAVKKHRASRTR